MASNPSEIRAKLFKETMNESYSLWRKKDNENAFRAIAKAHQYLPDFTDQLNYLLGLMEIKRMSARICSTDENPDYEAFLIYSLEEHALWTAKDISQFPFLSSFFHSKKIQNSTYDDNGSDSPEISPDEDDDMNIALKKLMLFKNRHKMFEEYLKFIYDELPGIYGVPSTFTEERMKGMKLGTDYWSEIHHRLKPKLNNKPIDFIPYEIHNFIIKLIKKYYDMGNA